jgi:hypothetical protein
MKSISDRGICGEDDFQFLREKEALTFGGNEGIFQAKKVKI